MFLQPTTSAPKEFGNQARGLTENTKRKASPENASASTIIQGRSTTAQKPDWKWAHNGSRQEQQIKRPGGQGDTPGGGDARKSGLS